MKCSNCLIGTQITICENCFKEVENEKDILAQNNIELRNKITRRNKQIKNLKKQLSDILNISINAHQETINDILKRQNEE